ncbi:MULTISPECIES: S-layer homology domain-containing protein [unclassified Paenibacillus]|uniref:S-layer homology domain-containing protein n=1 Tax=unclassified Paenibacillus TaxID=185978 RepID=UPI003629829C
MKALHENNRCLRSFSIIMIVCLLVSLLPVLQPVAHAAYTPSNRALYVTNTEDTVLPAANQLIMTAPTGSSTSSGQTNLLPLTTGWVEVDSHGAGSELTLETRIKPMSTPPQPSGHGFVFPGSLAGQTYTTSGVWHAAQAMKAKTSDGITGDLHLRVYKLSGARTANPVYTPIVDLVSENCRSTDGKVACEAAPASPAYDVTFGDGDLLYYDIVLKITKGEGAFDVDTVNGKSNLKLTTKSSGSYVDPPDTGAGPALVGVQLKGLSPTILGSAGATMQSVVTAVYSNQKKYDVTASPQTQYSSSDMSVATISQTGKVNAVGSGYSTITVTFKDVANNSTASDKYTLYVYPAIPAIKPPKPLATDEELDAIVRTTLNGISSYGWDPVNNGIFINWRRDDTSKVQCSSSSCDDRSKPTRHDVQNDIRALQHLYWFKWRNNGDTTYDTMINRLAPRVRNDWSKNTAAKGWLYYVFLRLYNYADNPADKELWRNTILNWAEDQFNSIDPALGLQHDQNMPNCDCGSSTIFLDDAYRVDRQVELGAALVDAGSRFNKPEWVTAGYKQTMTAYQQTFIEKYGLFARIYVEHDAKYGDKLVWDMQAKMGEVSEEIDALVRAGAVTTDPQIKKDFYDISTKMLNGLRTSPVHDKDNGGYFFKMYLGPSYEGKPDGYVDKSVKEMRQSSLLGTFHIANMLMGNQWTDLEQEMRAVVVDTLNVSPSGMFLPNTRPAGETLNGYPTSNAGYAYELNTDWTIYDIENWISNESNSLALLGIQQVLTQGLDGTELAPVAAVTASPTAGTVATGTAITLSTATPGATIYYTLDGSIPTLASQVFNSSSPILITNNTTVKAYAIKAHMIDSQVVTLQYTTATPTVADATLKSLMVNGGTLNETFAPGSLAYTVNVANNVTSVTVTPTANDAGATLRVNGAATVSGAVYGPIDLLVGINEIRIEVTAQSTTKTYTINVQRQSPTRHSSSNSSSGGSSASAPAATDPVNTKLVDDTSSLSVSTIVTEVGGVKTATAKVDAKAVESLMKDNSTGKIYLNVDSKEAVDLMIVTLTNDLVQSLSSWNKATIVYIDTKLGSYALALSEVNLQALAANLGVDQAKVELEVSIGKDDASKLQAQKAGMTVVGTVSYTVKAKAGKDIVIDTFNKYVSRVLKAEASSLSERNLAVVRVEKDSEGHVSYSPVPFKVNKSDVTIYSRSNSTYMVVVNNMTFADIQNHWAKDSIEQMANKMIVQGVSPDKFAPDQSVTRAEFAAILVRALGLSQATSGKTSFQDVKANDWYSGAVEAAVQAGMVSGYEGSLFYPDKKINREEMAVMLYRAMKFAGYDNPKAQEQITMFSDANRFGDWSKDAIAELAKMSIVNGVGSGEFAPAANASRAESAAMVQRVIDSLQYSS